LPTGRIQFISGKAFFLDAKMLQELWFYYHALMELITPPEESADSSGGVLLFVDFS